MAKEKKQSKTNPKVKKWILYSLFLVLFGTSAIVNIAYLPKYFALKNHQEETQGKILNVNVSAYDEFENKLISFHYQTILATLGNLMAQDSKTYNLKNFGEPLGKMLIGINYYQDNQWKTKEQENGYWWSIYRDGKITNLGIDSIFLKTNDNIELHYINNIPN